MASESVRLPDHRLASTMNGIDSFAHRATLTAMFIVIDAVSLLCAIMVLFGLNQFFDGALLSHLVDGAIVAPSLIGDGLVYLGVQMMMLWVAGAYAKQSWEIEELSRISAGVAAAITAIALTSGMFGFDQDIAAAIFTGAVATGAIMVGRMAARGAGVVKRGLSRSIIVVGSGVSSEDLRAQLRGSRGLRADMIGAYSMADFAAMLKDAPANAVAALAGAAQSSEHRVTVVLAPSPEELGDISPLLDRLDKSGVSHMIALPFAGMARRSVTVKRVFGGDIVFAELSPRKELGLSRLAKRILDIALATVALTASSPLLLFIAVMLLREKGPIFFSQKRIGQGRRRFGCLKFRTMVPDAEERLQTHLAQNAEARAEWAKYQKLSDDPRITWIGRFLRKSSIDELPQLINVLKGEMSLVGPRPIVAPEVPGYQKDHDYYESDAFDDYAQVPPGITGLWQVSGRASTTHDERVRLDRWYVRNWSIWLDVIIIFKTVRAAVLGTGSV